MAVLGGLIAGGKDHREVWQVLNVASPDPPRIDANDLYEDALPCLAAARTAGLIVGLAANQPEGIEADLERAGIAADFIATSSSWGVSKPSHEFFRRVVEAAGYAAEQCLYVGDRLDNDIIPAHRAGMRTAFIRRGPWGFQHAQLPDASIADYRIDSLGELEF